MKSTSRTRAAAWERHVRRPREEDCVNHMFTGLLLESCVLFPFVLISEIQRTSDRYRCSLKAPVCNSAGSADRPNPTAEPDTQRKGLLVIQ